MLLTNRIFIYSLLFLFFACKTPNETIPTPEKYPLKESYELLTYPTRPDLFIKTDVGEPVVKIYGWHYITLEDQMRIWWDNCTNVYEKMKFSHISFQETGSGQLQNACNENQSIDISYTKEENILSIKNDNYSIYGQILDRDEIRLVQYIVWKFKGIDSLTGLAKTEFLGYHPGRVNTSSTGNRFIEWLPPFSDSTVAEILDLYGEIGDTIAVASLSSESI